MGKFSIGGDDGEGSSSPRPKRLRFTSSSVMQCNLSGRPNPGNPSVPVRFFDLEGESSGDDSGSDPDRTSDVDCDEEEEGEEEEDDDDVTHEGDNEFRTVQDLETSESVVIGPIVRTDDQTRGVGSGGQRQGQRLDAGCSTAPAAATVTREVGPSSMAASVSVFLTDPEVFDCLICCEPLSAPIFQCENGHVACSTCCIRIHNKCPTCSMPIGYNRCRALEKVLESIKMACPNSNYGCQEFLSYGKKYEHENTCKHIPCLCPHPGCKYTSPSILLSIHLRTKHLHFIRAFQYNKIFPISLHAALSSFILQGEDDHVLFMIEKKSVGSLGSIVTLGCIGPHTSEVGYSYALEAKHGDSVLSLRSSTKALQGQIGYVPSSVFLLIPNDFFGAKPHTDFHVQISNKGTTLPSIGQ